MIAGVYNFTIEQGATFERVLTVRDSSDELFDFAGYTARMHIRPEIDSEVVMATLTTENGGITLGVDGVITLEISASDTSEIMFPGVYDLELVTADNKVYRLLKGLVRLDDEVTR